MSAIKKLIRFHRFQLDERRRGLRRLEEKLMEVDAEISEITTRIEEEKHFASENYEGNRDLNNFLSASFARIKQKRKDRELALGQVEAAREEVREAFADVKKYEITESVGLQKELRETERRERNELDEVALNSHRRKN
tara:strand:- start:133 stop:546 length:414 start_codon:yes stop_codon:yes gene_type:complete